MTGRFVRGDASRNTEGSGLGLAIASQVVEEHHGSIHVDSLVGKGSSFTVSLPR